MISSPLPPRSTLSAVSKKKAEEEKADQANVDMFDAIINVDTTNENSMALAMDMHKLLLKRNWYNATQRKAAETILGLKKPTESGTKVRDQPRGCEDP